MKRTPFYNNHIDHDGRMVDFTGWELPIYYTSIKKEHLAVRENVGIFDVSHMGDFFISGEGSAEFLKWLLPTDLTKLYPGQENYTHILDPDGKIIDDTIVLRKSENEFLMVPNAATTQKVLDHIIPLLPDDVTLEDRTMDIGCIALQGPLASRVLQKVTKTDISSIGFFQFRTIIVTDSNDNHHEVIASASGYTGESGYELYMDTDFSEEFWRMLMKAGDMEGITPCGLGARDTLRLEKGFLLSGTDFNDNRTPLETGCDWIIDWDHDFLGKGKLIEQRDQGDYHRFTGLVLKDRGIPRHGMNITCNGEPAGKVTSGTMSPTLGKGIALGYLKPEFCETGTEVEIVIRNKVHRAEVRKPPLV